MIYETLERFKRTIGNDPVFSIRSSLAALFICVPWGRGEDPLHAFFIAKGRDACIALNERKYFALATDTFHRYYQGDVSIGELEEEYARYAEHARRFYDEVVNQDLSLLTDEALRDHVRTVDDLYLELLQTLYIETIDFEKILSVIGLERKGNLDAIWERATQATFVSFEGRYLRSLIDLVSVGRDDAVQKAKFMFTDYFWMKSEGEIVAALNRIRDDLPEKIQESERLFAAAREQHSVLEAWQKTLDPDSMRIVEYMQLVMRLRDTRKDPIAQMLATLVELATEMTKRAEIELRFAPYILLFEYLKGVDHLKGIRDEVGAREQGCLYLVNPDCSYEIERGDFQDAIHQFDVWTVHHIKHDSDELRGQAACRGRVRATARVVSDPDDDRGFQEGDVLVTSMTRPEFISIMRKAGAVVTNEGGITCHAAIISRELNIPCVIGTKFATRVLHDGDLVEVDADNGIVRIIGK